MYFRKLFEQCLNEKDMQSQLIKNFIREISKNYQEVLEIPKSINQKYAKNFIRIEKIADEYAWYITKTKDVKPSMIITKSDRFDSLKTCLEDLEKVFHTTKE